MKKHPFRQGKTFYSLLAMLILITYIPILLAISLAQRNLNTTHQQQTALLTAVLNANLQYIQHVLPSSDYQSQVQALRKYTFLEDLDLESENAVAQAEQVLAEVATSALNSEGGSSFLYFPTKKYLIDLNKPGRNALGSISPICLLGVDEFSLTNIGVGRMYFYHNNEDPSIEHSIYTALIFPGVLFINVVSGEYTGIQVEDLTMAQLADFLEDVEICIYDSYGNYCLFMGDDDLISQFSYSDLDEKETSSFSFSAGKHPYLCSYTYNENDMTKLTLFCKDTATETLLRTTTFMWVSVGLFLLVALACDIFFARRICRQLRSLMDRLHVDQAGLINLRDEFSAMNQAMDSIDAQLGHREKLLAQYSLFQTLHGGNLKLLGDYADLWIGPEGEHRFAVAVVHVDEVNPESLLTEASLEQQIRTILHSEPLKIRFLADGDFFDLVFRLDQTFTQSQLMDVCAHLQAQLPHYCLSIFVSQMYPTFGDLRWGYSEAMLAAEYYIANDRINVLVPADLVPPSYLHACTTLPDFGLLKKLPESIVTVETQEALKTFDQLTNHLRHSKAPLHGTEDPNLNLLKKSIALALYDTGMISRDFLSEEVDQIRQAEDLDQVRILLQNALQKLERRMESQEPYDYRIDNIKEYICSHYSDPNLNAAMISEEFHVSLSTLTRLFKKYNGTGFLEYVHQVRVEQAIILLTTTNDSIAEISRKVGYTNTATMNRAFRTQAHSTPSNIRRDQTSSS